MKELVDKKVLRTAIYTVRCSRKEHRIYVSWTGEICLLDHGSASLQAVLGEGALRHLEDQGCYLFAKVVLKTEDSYWWRKHGKRRSSQMALLHKKGVPDSLFPMLAGIGSRRNKRISTRKFLQDKDPYEKPILISMSSRIQHFTAQYTNRHIQKMQRVRARLEKRGRNAV